MEWHWVPLAVIGAILWIIQNVRNQQPPEPPSATGRKPVRVPHPTRRAETVRPVPRADVPRVELKNRPREPERARPQPRLPVVGPPALPPRWTEPSAPSPASAAPAMSRSAAAESPAGPPIARSLPGRQAVALLKQPGSVAAAFVLREILDEPLCKRGRRRR